MTLDFDIYGMLKDVRLWPWFCVVFVAVEVLVLFLTTPLPSYVFRIRSALSRMERYVQNIKLACNKSVVNILSICILKLDSLVLRIAI